MATPSAQGYWDDKTLLRWSAVNYLDASLPAASAKRRLHPMQRNILMALAVLIVLGLIAAPITTIIAFNTVFIVHSLTVFALRGILLYLSSTGKAEAFGPETLLQDHELPIFTVLLPLYKEKEGLPGLVETLQLIDYPTSKLDIKLVMEMMIRTLSPPLKR